MQAESLIYFYITSPFIMHFFNYIIHGYEPPKIIIIKLIRVKKQKNLFTKFIFFLTINFIFNSVVSIMVNKILNILNFSKIGIKSEMGWYSR